MKAMVIGLGSMGRRRIRLLKLHDQTMEIIGVDDRDDRRLQAEQEFCIRTYDSIENAYGDNTDVALAFVSTSPLSHSQIIGKCLDRNLHTFTEINLVDDGYIDNLELSKKKKLVLFLSSTFLYRREIEYIKRYVNKSKCRRSYIYHVGQYLPDWHPWENYKDFFVADRRTNGCRELMAIEFPWLFDVFGSPDSWIVKMRKNTMLEVDYPDLFQIMFNHSNGDTGIVQIDLISRKAVRNFECISEDLYISWDGTPTGLRRFDIECGDYTLENLYDSIDKCDEYSCTIIENAYLAEIEEFLDAVNGRKNPRYSMEKDKMILSIINDIEGN